MRACVRVCVCVCVFVHIVRYVLDICLLADLVLRLEGLQSTRVHFLCIPREMSKTMEKTALIFILV